MARIWLKSRNVQIWKRRRKASSQKWLHCRHDSPPMMKTRSEFAHRRDSSKLTTVIWPRTRMKLLTWKCKIIVQINPRVSLGLPSTMSLGWTLTNLTFFRMRKLKAVSTFCSMWKRILPFSRGCVGGRLNRKSSDNRVALSYSRVVHSTAAPAVSTNSDRRASPETDPSLYHPPCAGDC